MTTNSTLHDQLSANTPVRRAAEPAPKRAEMADCLARLLEGEACRLSFETDRIADALKAAGVDRKTAWMTR